MKVQLLQVLRAEFSRSGSPQSRKGLVFLSANDSRLEQKLEPERVKNSYEKKDLILLFIFWWGVSAGADAEISIIPHEPDSCQEKMCTNIQSKKSRN